MKAKKTIVTIFIFALFMLCSAAVSAQPETSADQTLSPYFWVNSDDPELDQLPLKSTSARVTISGVIADVIVTQVYKNEGRKTLEAVYVFPASTRAAVYGMKMTIGERTIVAKICEREQARQEYEQAKQEGKSASLLEQHRPNVFQMNVANILPQDVIKVELKYTELLVPTDAVYEFVYPTVVGPRYSETTAAGAPRSEQWVENPYLHEGESPPYTFDIKINLHAGLSIQDVVCTSHPVNINYQGPDTATINLDPSEISGGNRDYILKYRLAGGQIETGLLLSGGKQEKFFLLLMQPPKRITEKQIPPREYVFIVDVSGSMRGFPLDVSKKLLKDLIGNLRSTDRFNVLLFAGGSSILAEKSLPATRANIDQAIHVIERQKGGGGTRLLPALQRALSLPDTESYSRSFIIITDGYVAVEEEAFDLIRNNLGNANMFTFGIGSSVNRHLIEGMARVGMGEPFIVARPKEASEKAAKFRKLIQSPVLTGIKVDFGDFDGYDVEPPSIPDVLADRPVILFGKWRGRLKGQIEISGTSGDHTFSRKIDVAKVKPLDSNAALGYLWARYRIMILSDYNRLRPNDVRIEEVTQLGLTYNLLTAYTSFVAIDSQVRLKKGPATTVKQPLPLPQGVSDYAVGKSMRVAKNVPSIAQAPAGLYREKAKMNSTLRFSKTERAVEEADAAELKEKQTRIAIGKISVGKGLPETSVKQWLEKQLRKINNCYLSISERGSIKSGKLVFELVIDSKGRVSHIDRVGKGKTIRTMEDCIRRHLKSLQSPIPDNGKKVKVIVVFILR
jgi:Ca-activated chloride channel family protein